MKYLVEHSDRYKEQIRMTLIAYNLQYIEEKSTDILYIYALDKGKLVGSLHTEMGWDTVSCKRWNYSNSNVLLAMIHYANNHYYSLACGWKVSSVDSDLITDLLQVGFTRLGELTYNPEGDTREFLYYSFTMDKYDSDELELIGSNTPLNEYEKVRQDDTNKESLIDNISIAVFDDEEFIGGISGYVQNKYLYTHLLAVADSYRGNSIGTELIKKIEHEATLLGAESAYVSTTSFQAFDFYIKCGYIHDVTTPNKPKGYKEYTFSKRLNGQS